MTVQNVGVVTLKLDILVGVPDFSDSKTVCVFGMRKREMMFQPVNELKKEVDFE